MSSLNLDQALMDVARREAHHTVGQVISNIQRLVSFGHSSPEQDHVNALWQPFIDALVKVETLNKARSIQREAVDRLTGPRR